MARFKNYKLVANYNEWRKGHRNTDIYSITEHNGGDVLFDVTEEDFIKMLDKGLVNSDGNYYLLNDYTEEGLERLAKEYGILWTSDVKKVYVFSSTETYKSDNDGILTEVYDTYEKAKIAFLEWKAQVLIIMLTHTHTKWDIITNTDDCFDACGTEHTKDNVYGIIDECIVK